GRVICDINLVSSQGTITGSAYVAVKDGVVGLTKVSSNDWVGEGTNVPAALVANPTSSKQIIDRIPLCRWGISEDFK
ncbi:hypothetical protein V1520DRAFT_283030, partial [Lipomyces starkeyi]